MAATELFANNASTTVAGAISNSATSVTLATGTGTSFPAPGPGQYFRASFFDAATGLITEIVFVTNVTGDTATIVRAQENTTAVAWNVGDTFAQCCTAGTMESFAQRTTLTGATTYYVNQSTGSNSNNGLTTGTAWATLQYAWNTVVQSVDTAGNIVTIQNEANLSVSGTILDATSAPVGGGSVVIDGGGHTAVATNGSCFVASNGGTFTVQNFSGTTATGTAPGQGAIILAANQGSITMGANMTIGIGAVYDIRSQFGGQIFGPSAYTVTTGTHVIHWSYVNGGQLYFNGTAITLSSTPACSSEWANGEDNATAIINCTYTGTGTGLTALIEMNATLDTGGALNLPGNGTYTLNSGGQKR